MAEYHLRTPVREEDITKLRIGDLVYLSGHSFTTRSKFQKAIFDDGEALPFALEDRNILIHCGPVVAKEEGKYVAKSFGPTTSVRMAKWIEKAIVNWNIKIFVGKGTLNQEVGRALAKHKSAHICTMGPLNHKALRTKQVVIQTGYWVEKLGSIEAPWLVELSEWGPFLVDIDTVGNNYFDGLDEMIAKKKTRVMKELGIPEDFRYTEL